MFRILILVIFFISNVISPCFSSVNRGNGSSFSGVTVYRGNGSSWNAVDIYRGNGSSWDKLNSSSGGACDGTSFCWLAESISVEVPNVTATLEGTTLPEIVSGGYSGNMIETNNDASGRVTIAVAESNFSEQIGRIDVWVKNNASAGSTTQRYVFEALGQTGVFAISITHIRVTVTYGSATTTLDTVTNYLEGGLRHLIVTWDATNDIITINVDDTYTTTNSSMTGEITGQASSIVLVGRNGTTGYVSADEIKHFSTVN